MFVGKLFTVIDHSWSTLLQLFPTIEKTKLLSSKDHHSAKILDKCAELSNKLYL